MPPPGLALRGVVVGPPPPPPQVRRAPGPQPPPLQPLPTLRDPDNLVYWRTEGGGLIMGGYERDPAPWALDGVPDGFEAQLLPEDWERVDELLGHSIRRVPAMEAAVVQKHFHRAQAVP